MKAFVPTSRINRKCGPKFGPAGKLLKYISCSHKQLLLGLLYIYNFIHTHTRYTQFGGPAPHRPAEDLAFAVARFVQNNGSYFNYYMVSMFFIL